MSRTTGEFPSEGVAGVGAVRILVVDDRPANRLTLIELLQGEGRTIVTAGSGNDALRWLMQHDFAVVLLDVNMPGMDGFEVARMIRGRPRSSDTPIIFVTAISVEDEAVHRGYQLGAVDYIFTPIVPVVLQSKVSVFVDLYRKTKSLEASLREREASESRYLAIFRDSPVPLWELDLTVPREHVARATAAGANDLAAHFRRFPDELPRILSSMRLLQVNRAAVDMCEAESAERVVSSLTQIFGDNSASVVVALISDLATGKPVAETEATLRTIGGSLKQISARVSVLPAAGGGWSRVVVSANDIAELHRQRTELERSNRELQQFAYVASHDLRAPLRAIDSLSEWLSEELGPHLSSEQTEQMRLLRGRVRRMDRLLEDLLTYSRAGGEAHAVEVVETDTVIHEASELASCPPGFRVESTTGSSTIATARVALRRVLLNLIVNAFKHHDKANGRVDIRVTDVGDALCFEVQDDGPGIPPRFSEKVFQMFQTLKPRDAVDGSGMGLALVRKLVDGAGGKVELEPREGRGALVRFTWPKHWRQRPPSRSPMPQAATP